MGEAMNETALQKPVPARKPSPVNAGILQQRQARLAWVLLLPALAVVAFVAVYPLGMTIYQSFTDQQFLAGIQPTNWVGLRNYTDLIHDEIFRNSILTTIKFTVITVVFEFVLGMIVALVVN
jgi:trehalose/maltose transport system permease protein